MQRLVSPELKIYVIRGALSELVTELRLDSTLAGNLRQLLGYQTVGPDARPPNGRELAAPGIGALAEASGERKARSGRGQQCDPHFQTLLSTDSRRALT